MSTLSEQIERHSVVTLESSIPDELTIGQWRSMRREHVRRPERVVERFLRARAQKSRVRRAA
jgi:hypothetical protein